MMLRSGNRLSVTASRRRCNLSPSGDSTSEVTQKFEFFLPRRIRYFLQIPVSINFLNTSLLLLNL